MTRATGEHAHLSIGEVLSLLQEEFPDVTISKIRFLESQGLLDPERTPSGYRKFYEADIERLRWILTQQRENFLPLKVIKDRLEEVESGAPADTPEADAAAMAAGAAASAGADEAVAGAAAEIEAKAKGAAAPATNGGDQPVPIWMADAAKVAASRTTPEPSSGGGRRAGASKGGAGGDGGAARSGIGSSPLDVGPTSVSLTRAELCSASHLQESEIEDLESYGLLEGRNVGADVYYDGDALVVAQKAAGFIARGIEPRHLRMFKVAAEREAGFLEQVVMPMLKQRNPDARHEAQAILGELAALGQSLRAALLRHALRDHLG
jgi:DNA-binding transcriptional MerR regulator